MPNGLFVFLAMAFNARFVLNIIHFAHAQGASFDKLISLSGHSPEALSKEDLQVSAQVYNAVLEEAVALTKDNYFGLHASENMNLSAAGLIVQITQSSSTVKEALDYCCEFSNLGCKSIPMNLVEGDDFFKLAFIPDRIWATNSPLSAKHTIDGMMAFTIREFHTLTRQKYYPAKIELGFERPKDITEYERVFQCPLEFGKKDTVMFFKKEHLSLPVITSNYDLLKVLVAHANEKLAQIKEKDGFYFVVKRSVMNLVKPEFPTVDQVAANLNLSVRTLQRRLSEEGYTYKEIIEVLRKDMALSYLKKPEISIKEVAYLLSYADPSVFIRSFKRWTGETPKAYRESYLSRVG